MVEEYRERIERKWEVRWGVEESSVNEDWQELKEVMQRRLKDVKKLCRVKRKGIEWWIVVVRKVNGG